MQKIQSLIVNGQVDPAIDWLDHAKPTQMYDGKPYAVINNKPYSHLISSGQITQDVIACNTFQGELWCWQPVPADDEDFWRMWIDTYQQDYWDWTYEMVGPGINGDPEQAKRHVLRPHGTLIIHKLTPTIEAMKKYLITTDSEGIVWWEDPWDVNCRKVKVQQSDFNYKRGKRKTL